MISGRGSNLVAITENVKHGILQGKCIIQAVFSNKRNAAGLQKAEQFGIPTHVISSKAENYNFLLLDWLRSKHPDLIILAGYMKILPAEIVRAFPQKIINIHPADTKEHQGLNGYKWAWEKKLAETKITVHVVDEGLDSGKIIGQRVVDLRGAESLAEIEKRGLQIEHEFYSECIKLILEKID